MSDSKKTDNDGVAVKTKDRPPKITSSKSTGEITIKHRKIEKKDKGDAAKDGSVTDRTEKDKEKDKKEKKEKKNKSSDPSKKDKKKRDSFRLSKSLVDPKDESKTTSTSDDHKQSPHTIGTPHPLTNSLSSPSIKAMESSSGSKSGGHSRHSSNDTSNTNSTPRKKTPRSPRIDALKESEDADEHTDEDKQTIATLKQKRDQFIRTISSRHVQLPMHVKAVFSETIEESDEESSSSGMDWEDPNFELQIDQQIKELGEPLPEETTLLSNLQSMLKIPTWKNDDWIQTLQEEKDRIEKDKRKSLNTDQIETQVGGRRTSLGPMSSPAGSRSTIEGPAGRSNRASSGSSKLGVMKAKVGYVLQKSKLGPWKRRYLILDDTRLTAKKSPMEMKAKLVVPMLFSQCKSIDKPLSGKRKLYMFEIFTPDTKFLMATDSQQSTLDWVTAIQKACDNQMLQSLDLQENANGHDKEDLKPEVKELLEIMKLPGNNICTDCDAADPEWAVINIGNFVCIDCSGVHRALGVQVSKVRSIYLDNWEPEAVAYMRTMGNKKVNEIWENKVPSYREKPKQNATREKRMFWIVSKYVKKEFFDWSRAGEAKVDPENHQSISNTVLAAKMIPNDMAELKKAILNLVKEDESFRKQMKDLIFGDNEMRQVMDSESSANNTSVSASKDKGRTRATTTTGL